MGPLKEQQDHNWRAWAKRTRSRWSGFPAGLMLPKPVYLNCRAAPIGMAATWWDVAVIVSKIAGRTFTAKEMQGYASEVSGDMEN